MALPLVQASGGQWPAVAWLLACARDSSEEGSARSWPSCLLWIETAGANEMADPATWANPQLIGRSLLG